MRVEFWKPTIGGAPKMVLHRDGKEAKVEATTLFFVRHDLTHYAVETVLVFRRAFWGLIADGWEIESFEARRPGSRKAVELPDEAILAERIVSLFDLEFGGWPEFDAVSARKHFLDSSWGELNITTDKLTEIRVYARKLHTSWNALQSGEHLDLQFPPV
ncbi:MAG: hypothetical protein U0R49_12605 [Fimbriimonadales bacterium]